MIPPHVMDGDYSDSTSRFFLSLEGRFKAATCPEVWASEHESTQVQVTCKVPQRQSESQSTGQRQRTHGQHPDIKVWGREFISKTQTSDKLMQTCCVCRRRFLKVSTSKCLSITWRSSRWTWSPFRVKDIIINKNKWWKKKFTSGRCRLIFISVSSLWGGKSLSRNEEQNTKSKKNKEKSFS